MKYLTLLLILLFSFALLCFLYLNQGLVVIKYFPGDGHQAPPIPLFAVIMLAVIAGVLMAGVIGMGEQLRLRFRLRQANRRNIDLEQRLETITGEADSPDTVGQALSPVGESQATAELPPLGDGETAVPDQQE